jgi:arginine metabolism regulation protein II
MGDDLDDICGGDFESGLVGQNEAGVSLFGEIYGIPESLLSLISHATSLSNELLAMRTSTSDLSISHDLAQRSKILENQITSWQCPPQSPMNSPKAQADEAISANQAIMHHLILAIHGALLIYFYRRISNLNPTILQGYVDETIDHLLQCEQEKLNANLINCGIAWPGFIAATEAIGEVRQMKILGWLRQSSQVSGMRNFDVAADVAERVWQLRREGRPDATWVDVVKESKAGLVLT